jgi:hypothetical protein
MSGAVVCKQIKCKDYLTDGGEPAWCYRAGMPAQVAMVKCPKVIGEKTKETSNLAEKRHHEIP